MAFNTAAPRVEYEATSGQTVFSFLFKIFVNSDVKVYLTPVGQEPDDTADLLTLDTNYTVTPNGDSGGTITLLAVASAGDLITIIRDLPTQRDIDYQTNGDLLANTLDDDQNYQTYLIADGKQAQERFLQFPQNAQGVDNFLPTPVAGNFLRWNQDANAVTNAASLEADGYLWTAADVYTKTEIDNTLTPRLNHIPVSKVLAGYLAISNVVSIVSDSDPFSDSSQVFKWELDGNANDTDTTTPINGTPTNVTWDFENQKFGSGQAVFDGTAYISGTASIASSNFSYNFVVTPSAVDSTNKFLIDFTTGRGILANGNTTTPTENLSYFDGVAYNDLGYKLTVGKQETVGITLAGTTLKLYIDGLLHSTHTVGSTSIDGVFTLASRNPTSGLGNYFIGSIDQAEVYNRTLTDAEMESLYFQEVTRTDNTVNSTGLVLGYSNGYDNGAKNTQEAITDGAKTITLSASAINYIYKIEGNDTLQATTVEPVFGLNNKRTSAVNPDVFVDGKWWNSTNGDELVTNGTDFVDTTGWTPINASLSVVDGKMRITSSAGGVTQAYQEETVVIGKKYRAFLDVPLEAQTGSFYVSLGTTAGGIDIGYGELTEVGTVYFDFTPTTTTVYIHTRLDASTLASEYLDVKKISLFEEIIEPDTAYTTPRTYIQAIEADSAGYPSAEIEWQPATLVEKRVVSQTIRANEKFEGKNACTAWVNFDGTTTPPTIKDSFNVSDVIKTATGKYEIVFEENLDDENYTVKGNVGSIGAIGSNRYSVGSTKDKTACYVTSEIASTNAFVDNAFITVNVYGGKN